MHRHLLTVAIAILTACGGSGGNRAEPEQIQDSPCIEAAEECMQEECVLPLQDRTNPDAAAECAVRACGVSDADADTVADHALCIANDDGDDECVAAAMACMEA